MTEGNDLKMVFTQNCFGVVRHGNPPPSGPFPFTLGLLQHEASEVTRRVNSHETLVKALEAMLKAYNQLMPGLVHIAVQDYANINEAPIIAKAALTAAGKLPK